MKKNLFLLFVLGIFISNLQISSAQSVKLDAISAASFCTGDSVTATFTVSGYFGHKNAFTLQLSDPNGGFTSGFNNLGSIVDTLPGVFTIGVTIPSVSNSFHYRFRILGAIPYVPSADNGTDITIGLRPYSIYFNRVPVPQVGLKAKFEAFVEGADAVDSVFWDFGEGANPSTFSERYNSRFLNATTTYMIPGDKKITVKVSSPLGCSRTMSTSTYAFDCSSPHIPHSAKVLDTNGNFTFDDVPLWVNPGVKVILSGHSDTVFAEPGSTIVGCESCILFMKQGSVYFQSSSGGNVLVYANGASIDQSSDYLIPCPSLDFDYTSAPPNVAHPLSVKYAPLPLNIQVSPNPTSGAVLLSGVDRVSHLSVLNILGNSEMEFDNLFAPEFRLDLSKLSQGTYYLRFTSANSVVTKMVVKE